MADSRGETKRSLRHTEANVAKMAHAERKIQDLLVGVALIGGFHGQLDVKFIIADGTIQKVEAILHDRDVK